MPCALHIFAFDGQFLEELFTGPGTCINDFNIFFRPETAEGDKLSGQVLYSYRLAHIEHENLPTFSHGGRLQNKLAGFRYGHKVPLHVGMRHGHGPAFRYLFLKNRHDRTFRVEDVAEPHRDEVCFTGPAEVLNIHLCDSFGGPHDTGRIDGFVGADHDEVHGDVPVCGICEDLRTDHIVLDRFARIKLHQRDMLVSGSVNDNLRLILFKNLIHSVFVGDIADKRFNIDPRKPFA